METTRHFVASVYVVNDGAVAFHDHKKLDLWLAAGGHIDPKELPHEAARRECIEEMGIDPTFLDMGNGYTSQWVDDAPAPAEVLIENIDVGEDGVYHKHVDLIFFATADTRQITPEEDDEVGPEDWEWFTADELKAKEDDEKFTDDAIQLGLDAIDAAEQQSP